MFRILYISRRVRWFLILLSMTFSVFFYSPLDSLAGTLLSTPTKSMNGSSEKSFTDRSASLTLVTSSIRFIWKWQSLNYFKCSNHHSGVCKNQSELFCDLLSTAPNTALEARTFPRAHRRVCVPRLKGMCECNHSIAYRNRGNLGLPASVNTEITLQLTANTLYIHDRSFQLSSGIQTYSLVYLWVSLLITDEFPPPFFLSSSTLADRNLCSFCHQSIVENTRMIVDELQIFSHAGCFKVTRLWHSLQPEVTLD